MQTGLEMSIFVKSYTNVFLYNRRCTSLTYVKKYHSLLNSAIALVERNKHSHSYYEREALLSELVQIEFQLQCVETYFLNEAYDTPTK